ncbi:PAS domain S-box protein [Ferruginibacter sp. HRS2-29]|uniref:PAS domain S-box protein n=1 Tax=Ferruginibacter sp. HRS2-29 TaxID=2487334 RepID=UPI0020CE8570|nr:PAS domain S-box protein [Ferruginibacter sp. HRS2-29]MCP9749654.1 PAS domain S-box protein [Ferruginibacter sp. HRS2-29]
MKHTIKILHLEDTRFDVEMVERELQKAALSFEMKVADNKRDFELAILDFQPDIVLSDHSLASFDSVGALELLRSISADIPFILVTSTVSEEFAADIIKLGAADYILKDRLTRLPAAIIAALKSQAAQIDKRNAEQQIEISENNLRTIFENASEGFLLTDREGMVRAFNNKAEGYAFFIREKKIKVGDPVLDFVAKPRKNFFRKIMSRVLSGEEVSYESLYEHPREDNRWIDLSITPVREGGEIRGLCITGRDITEKKKAQQEREFAHSNLHALINNTRDLIWSIDHDFNLITSNEPFNRMFEQASGKRPVPGDPVLVELFDTKQQELYTRFYSRALLGETFTGIDDTVEGTWSEISFYPIFEKASIVGTACFLRNITDSVLAQLTIRQSHEENLLLASRLSAIINTLPANIALLDQEGSIMAINDSWKNFGDSSCFTGEEYGIGENYVAMAENAGRQDIADGKKLAAGITGILHNLLDEFVFEYACDARGSQRWFRMMVTPLKHKEFSGAVVMHLDISEIKRLEEERLAGKLNEQKKITLATLLGQEKERNRIGRELHDNINQILAGTKLYLSSAANKNAEVKELIRYPLELIDSSIEEIRILCKNLVTPLKNIDLRLMIDDLLQKFDLPGIKKEFRYHVEENISDDLKINIYRIVQEQLNNIFKYAEASIIHVAIRSSGGELLISITDDGRGFDVDQKRHGIGLSNMINRVESFYGDISIKSEPGKGCRVDILIPISNGII